MANPNPSTFLGNVHWKVVKQWKNSDYYSIFHNATVTVNLFDIFEMYQMCLTCTTKCIPQFGYGKSKSIIIFRQYLVVDYEMIEKQRFLDYFL